MLEFFYKIIDFFSPYANKFEKTIDKFLSSLSPGSNRFTIEKKVLEFMQKNLVTFHLWSERRYKGYFYLHKKMRRELYENTEKIKADFSDFMTKTKIDINQVYAEIESHDIPKHRFASYQKELEYLAYIMAYLNPSAGRFVYRESSNFGALLHDPKHEKLVGDCNQIVTLYVYLYSQKFSIKDLEIKTPPEHVCLHFRGIDIEATNGHFAKYTETPKVHKITELMAVNLLDTTDSYAKTHEISPKALLESSKLAYLLSSNQDLVKHNLKAAYYKLTNQMMSENKHELAFTYAQQSKDEELIKYIGHNTAIYFLNHNDFPKAYRYGRYSKDEKLEKSIIHSEGVYYLNKQQFEKAISIFRRINEPELIKQSYAGLAIELQNKLVGIKTIEELKKKRSTLYKIRDYARQSGDPKLLQNAEDMLRQAS